MRIAWCEPHLQLVGGIRRIIEITNRLIDFGHENIIYTPVGKPCRWLDGKAPVLKLEKLPKQKFDVVIFNLAEQYKHVLNCEAKVKVFWVLAPEALYKQPDIPIIALQQNFFFLANSTFTANYIKQYRRVKYEIPVIGGAVNSDHFHYDATIPKRHHILYYGSKRPWKGSSLIKQALDTPKLKTICMEGLNTPQKDMWRLYAGATLFLAASQVEGFSFPELEAMACGTPVVCTDSGGNRDYATSKNAVTVSRNVQAVRQGVHLVLNDKDLRRQLRREGLKTARDAKYNWDNVTKKLEGILEGILKNGTVV